MSAEDFVLHVDSGSTNGLARCYAGFKWPNAVQRALKFIKNEHLGLAVNKYSRGEYVNVFLVHDVDELVAVYTLSLNTKML